MNIDEVVSPQPVGTPASSTSGRNSGPIRQHARPATPNLDDDTFPVIYEGTDDECSFCQEPHRGGDRVVRLACRHVFHAQCWERWCAERPRRCCPNCRGAGTCIAIWNYIGPGSDTQTIGGVTAPNELEQHAQLHNIVAPDMVTPPTPRSVDYDDRPMPGASASSAALYCSSYPIQTRLASGRPSIIIDPGSVGNLCGDKWAREVATLAFQNGHKPRNEKRPRPLEVSGVGNGSQKCHYDCTLPVAFRTKSGNQKSVLGNLTSPAVANSELPGLLGLKALIRNNFT